MLRVSPVAFLLLVPLTCVRAQSTNASLTGRVTDPSKSFIADAKLAAISAATNFRYETTTNTSGEYYLANLPPGLYQIEIEKPGFKKLIKPDVILHVQDALAIDFEMTLGSATDTITVESGARLLNTESATVSTVIDHTFVENLPLNGRSFQTLIFLTPGVVVTATAFNDQGQFSVNGQRADANYFTVDGVSANFGVTGTAMLVQTASGSLPALSSLGGTNSLVSVDAMQEFRIQTSSFAPEFGRTPGGQVSIVTRSGTNAFHGTLFDYFRNSVLDANDWFANLHHLPKPVDKQNDFGGVFGGPVLKDKTFFFFSYEGLRLRQPFTQETVVPCDSTCQVFGNARGMAPPTTQPYLKAYPIPNGPELFKQCTPNVNGCPASGQQPTGSAQFNGSYANPASLDAYSIRVDQVLSSKLNLFGRYNYSPSSITQRGPFSPTSVLSTTQSTSFSVQTLTVGLTVNINQRISNDVRANYSNDRANGKYTLDSFGGAVPLPDSLLFPTGFSSANGIFIFGGSNVGTLLKGKLSTDEQRQVNLLDNLSLTMGNHQLKFGADYRRLAPFVNPFAYEQSVQFSGIGTAAGGALSGTALAAFVYARQGDALRSQNFSFYGQDAWKVIPRLTVTFGLRWDINPPSKGANLANYPFTVEGLNDPATMTLAPRGTPLYDTTYGNFAPRLGLAYQFSGLRNWQAVLRGGFGVFYDLGSGSLGGVSYFFPYSNAKTVTSPPFPLSPQNAAPPPLTLNPPAQGIFVADRNLKLPRTYQWNVALEQSIGSAQSLSVTYIGAIGRDLLRLVDLFNPNPNFNLVFLTDNSATSDYHTLQIKYQRRLSRGLQALASYSFARSIDIASTDANTSFNTPGSVANPNVDRGDSDFDIRHSFTAGVTYDLPTPESQKVVHAMFGGWSVDSFIMARSAPPVDIVGAESFAEGVAFYPRPDVVPGVPLVLNGSQYPGGKIFNKAAFTPPPQKGQQGDFGRNVLRGFGAWQADVALQRQFHVTERLGLRFRSEFFNIFNHPNFGSPNNTLSSPLFGHSTQMLASSLASTNDAGFNPLYQIGGPRSIQLALKLQF